MRAAACVDFLGPGHHLFISAVSRAWKESYRQIASVEVAALTYGYDCAALQHTATSQTTLYSSIFASASRVMLAFKCGLAFDTRKIQRIAGRTAALATLYAAHKLGLPLTSPVLVGAAVDASVPKLEWLHVDQRRRLPDDISCYAARSGSVSTLVWLKKHGCRYRSSTCVGAAAGAHMDVLEYLRDERCAWDEDTCSAAAKNGHLTTLLWLFEQECPYQPYDICDEAAESGSIETLHFLRQEGCAYTESTMVSAAMRGHLHVCQFLMAEHCPCGASACAAAAERGHLETVRFLHESGCPWNADTICIQAVMSGDIDVLQYFKQQGCVLSEAVMSTAAQRGDLHICQYLRAEQCPWDSTACGNAAREGHLSTLRWLHEQGCPWDVQALRRQAAAAGLLDILQYTMLDVEPVATAAQLTDMLSAAGFHGRLPVAQWLRLQGAEWPAALRFNGFAWETSVLQWARIEGCTSPSEHLMLPLYTYRS
jgi:hypothetical protein